ncbi:MAG: hypothetical protein OXM55_03460 [Bdellovibrionales bacterium]|nr:hypothetical protein [Bdellovibrionales bacterium]
MLQYFYETFQQKLPLGAFERKFSTFINCDIKREESWTKTKGVKTDCDEISVLLDLAKYYKASHLKWTGNHTLNCHFDGILYFNGTNEQKIEISRILDEQIEKDTKEKGEFSRTFIFEDIDKEYNNQFFLDSTKVENIKRFIYDRIVNILLKKSKQQYKGCWLTIAYEPVIIKINKDYVNKPIFKKIEHTRKQLLFSTREIFKKIIFVPNGMRFKVIQSNEFTEYKTFEWK